MEEFDQQAYEERQRLLELSFAIGQLHLEICALTVAAERMADGPYHATIREMLDSKSNEWDELVSKMVQYRG